MTIEIVKNALFSSPVLTVPYPLLLFIDQNFLNMKNAANLFNIVQCKLSPYLSFVNLYQIQIIILTFLKSRAIDARHYHYQGVGDSAREIA